MSEGECKHGHAFGCVKCGRETAPVLQPCGHDVLFGRAQEGCLACRADLAQNSELGSSARPQEPPVVTYTPPLPSQGMSSLEGLALAKKHGLRVTFGRREVTVERENPDRGEPSPWDWLEVASGKTFLDAMILARDRMGLTL